MNLGYRNSESRTTPHVPRLAFGTATRRENRELWLWQNYVGLPSQRAGYATVGMQLRAPQEYKTSIVLTE